MSTVAAIQMTSGHRVQDNLEAAGKLLREAKDAGADKIQSRVARIDAESLVRGGGGVGDLALPVFDLSRSGKQRN